MERQRINMKNRMRIQYIILGYSALITILSIFVIFVHIKDDAKNWNPFFIIVEWLNTLFIFLFYSVNRKVINKILFGKKDFKKEHQTLNVDILEKFLKTQLKKNTLALITDFICLIIYSCLYFVSNMNLEHAILIILNILPWMIILYRVLVIYRVKNQFYGTNYDEAKELICFIKKSRDNDSQNGNYYFYEEKLQVPATDKFVEYL